MATIVTKGNEIIVESNPKGVHKEVIVVGTPKPGTCMMLQTGTDADANGHHSYVPATGGSDGAARSFCILTNELGALRGRLITDALVTGDLEKVYFPLAGEEFNMLCRDQPGTGTLGLSQVGDKLGIDAATGLLQPVNVATPVITGAYAPFELLVRLGTDQTANFHAWVRYRGAQAAAT